jgi:hypothetical protein
VTQRNANTTARDGDFDRALFLCLKRRLHDLMRAVASWCLLLVFIVAAVLLGDDLADC